MAASWNFRRRSGSAAVVPRGVQVVEQGQHLRHLLERAAGRLQLRDDLEPGDVVLVAQAEPPPLQVVGPTSPSSTGGVRRLPGALRDLAGLHAPRRARQAPQMRQPDSGYADGGWSSYTPAATRRFCQLCVSR